MSKEKQIQDYESKKLIEELLKMPPMVIATAKTSIEIEDASDADVVEVVRCKDCKWFNKIGCAIKIVDESDKPHEDDFCSFAERRTDESD